MVILNLELMIKINHHTNIVKDHDYNEMNKSIVRGNSTA